MPRPVGIRSQDFTSSKMRIGAGSVVCLLICAHADQQRSVDSSSDGLLERRCRRRRLVAHARCAVAKQSCPHCCTLWKRVGQPIWQLRSLGRTTLGLRSPSSAHVQSILQNREIWAANVGCSNVSKGYLMAIGTVKWFNNQKGFGFIQPETGGSDVFVHISAVERAGMSTLNEGQRISYDVVNERGKNSAANLKSA